MKIKDFIPYQEALSLKELGFNEPCVTWYFDRRTDKINQPADDCFVMLYAESQPGSGMSLIGYKNTHKKIGDTDCTAPLYQQAFRWFREKHNIDCNVNVVYKQTVKAGYYFGVCPLKGVDYFSTTFSTFEEAQLECLNKVIELLKKNS